MTTADDRQAELYYKAGHWGHDPATHSLDGLLKQRAMRDGDQLAICDDPSKPQWTGSPARSLSFNELDSEVELLAAFLRGLNLGPSAVVAYYGPGTVEAYVSILAIHRAGLAAAPIPLFWREHDLKDYLDRIQARAIITCDRVEDDNLGLRARNVAQEMFNIRYVFGYGEGLPDGVMNLDQIMEMASAQASEAAFFDLPNPGGTAILLPPALANPDLPPAIKRSSNHLNAAYQAAVPDIPECKRLLLAFAPTGYAGILMGLLGLLRSSHTLYLHHYRDADHLSWHIEDVAADCVVVPNSIAEEVPAGPSMVCLVHKNSHLPSAFPIDWIDQPPAIFDLTILNEFAAIGLMRPSGQTEPEGLPIDPDQQTPGLLKVDIRGRAFQETISQQTRLRGGEIVVAGASVPGDFFHSVVTGEPDGASYYAVKVNGNRDGEADETIIPLGFLGDVATLQGYCIAGETLDDFFKQVPGVVDAAHFVVTDTGSLWAAIVTDYRADMTPSSFKTALSDLGLSALYHPDELLVTNKIPRGVGDIVLRGALMSEATSQDMASSVASRSLQQAG
ncbi:MAG: AMP-binding protein [Pseudomonadota bacterium]